MSTLCGEICAYFMKFFFFARIGLNFKGIQKKEKKENSYLLAGKLLSFFVRNSAEVESQMGNSKAHKNHPGNPSGKENRCHERKSGDEFSAAREQEEKTLFRSD